MAAVGNFFAINYIIERERRRRNEARLINRNLRDSSDVFQLPEHTFLKLFRLNKEATHFLIEYISPHLNDGLRNTAIPVHLKILCTLNFLGHGCYQLDTGTTLHFSMSQSSVSRCISEVCNVINNVILQRWIVFPITPQDINRNINLFFNRYGFPGIVGSIDFTHVAIISPPNDHPQYPAGPYYNRKGYYSINVQLLANAELKILNVNARFPGSVHDTAIWQMSRINLRLQRIYFQGDLNYHLIGDEGYPLSPWLLTQYAGNVPNDTPQGRFNIHLRRARVTIERVNGILKGRFRCLLKHRTLNYNPIKAGIIINTCAVLHNIALHFNADLPDDFPEIVEEEIFNNDIQEGNFFVQGKRKRDLICDRYFR